METKERIITESLKLFTRYGIRSITMDAIAENLGISKRTIYELFKNKDELLENCIIHSMKEKERNTEIIINNSANVIDAFLSVIKESVNIMKEINPIFFLDAKKYHPEVFRCKGKEHEEKEYNIIIQLIKQGEKEGYIKKDINEEIITKLVMEQFKILGDDELFPPEKYSKSEIFKNIAINFIRGIATEKGLKIIDNNKS